MGLYFLKMKNALFRYAKTQFHIGEGIPFLSNFKVYNQRRQRPIIFTLAFIGFIFGFASRYMIFSKMVGVPAPDQKF